MLRLVTALAIATACSAESGDPVSPESGGASGSGATGGQAGGSGGISSGGSGGGTAGAGGSAGTPGVSCSSLPICDDFETAVVGGPPGSAWSVVSPDCSGTGTLAVDDTQAHSGTKSVKVSGAGGFCNHVFFANTSAFPLASDHLFGRFWIRLGAALPGSHVTFLAFAIPSDGAKHLRMGGQNGVLMWNRESDDATLPAMSPAGIATSLALAVDTWTCIEIELDGAAGKITTWVDDNAITGLTVDGTPTPDIDEQWLGKPSFQPKPADIALGWESYGGDPMTLFIDDVAMGPERIGCAE